MTLARNYAVLPDGYGDTLVMCETLGEIMSDKLISLAATTKYIRYRDLWDLPWLLQQGASYDVDLIRRKIEDYRIPDYKELLARRLQSIDTIVSEGRFYNEMRRFLPQQVFDRTLGRTEFIGYLSDRLKSLLNSLQQELQGNNANDSFRM